MGRVSNAEEELGALPAGVMHTLVERTGDRAADREGRDIMRTGSRRVEVDVRSKLKWLHHTKELFLALPPSPHRDDARG
jgi:hypothetical protein